MQRGGRSRRIPMRKNIARANRVTGAADGRMEAAGRVAHQRSRWGKSISAICRISATFFGLFQITPSDTPLDGVQLAGDDGKPLLDSFGEPYYAPKGHHELPKSVFKAWDLPEETARVFDRATTGQLPAGRTEIEGKLRGHLWDDEHRKYSEAVRELTERFMKERDIIPSRMTPEQAKDLLREIRDSENSSIRDYNRIMRMLRRIFRGGRE